MMAPELQTTDWFNTDRPLTLESLRGRVVMIEAFQMLCPGCVARGLPQLSGVAETFRREDVVALGPHSVFGQVDDLLLGARITDLIRSSLNGACRAGGRYAR